MILVSGANGKLGNLVIEHLVKTYNPRDIVAGVRSPEKAKNLEKLGVTVRRFDYEDPQSLDKGLEGITKLLMISSSEVGKRAPQHANIVKAAQKAKVQHIIYTSILRADKSGLGLAKEHYATEKLITDSGIKYTFLRNGWYLENHTENLNAAIEHGAILGAAGEGRFASAARTDYAQAAVKVLTTPGRENKIYELAGDTSFTLSDLAAALGKKIGRPVVYKNMPKTEFQKTLESFGLPPVIADMLADSDEGASRGDLDSTSKDLKSLIGHPTMTLAQALDAAVK